VTTDTDKRRGYLQRQLAELDRIARATRSPETKTAVSEERRELRAQLAALDTEATTA
jgi:hypothetical protein